MRGAPEEVGHDWCMKEEEEQEEEEQERGGGAGGSGGVGSVINRTAHANNLSEVVGSGGGA